MPNSSTLDALTQAAADAYPQLEDQISALDKKIAAARGKLDQLEDERETAIQTRERIRPLLPPAEETDDGAPDEAH